MNTNNNPNYDMSAHVRKPSGHGSDTVRTQENNLDTQWLTVEEAYQYLLEHNITRSPKTIRRRCQSGGFKEVKKTETPNGWKYEISKAELDTYIKTEEANNLPRRIYVNMSGQDREVSGHVSDNVHTRPDTKEINNESRVEDTENENLLERIKELEADNAKLKAENINLEIEKKVAYQTRDYVQNMADRLYEDLTCKEREHRLTTNNLHHQLGEAKTILRLNGSTETITELDDGDNDTPNAVSYTVQ